MICEPCKIAGRFIVGLKNYPPESDHDKEWTRGQAANFHAECEHPETCTCQHVISLEAVNE